MKHGWIGLALIGVCWPLNWMLEGSRTAYLFFPLWFGYVLTIDALVLRRSGTSLIKRMGSKFTLLFLLSAPAWWIFELVNLRTQNWEYVGGLGLGRWLHFFLSSVAFSTVIPAVFETAELVRTFRWVERLTNGPRLESRLATRLKCFGIGALMLAVTLVWPRIFYPLVWCGLWFIIEPFNAHLGRPTLLRELKIGNWRPVVCLGLGALACGFFWEMWNYFSFPKWVYHIPGVGFYHVFEMPILGYFGYIPFSWELFALSFLLWPRAPRLRI